MKYSVDFFIPYPVYIIQNIVDDFVNLTNSATADLGLHLHPEPEEVQSVFMNKL